MAGKDVENQGGAVDHGQAELLLQVALLARRELVVGHHHVGTKLLCELLDLTHLAWAHIGVRVRLIAVLHHLADHLHLAVESSSRSSERSSPIASTPTISAR